MSRGRRVIGVTCVGVAGVLHAAAALAQHHHHHRRAAPADESAPTSPAPEAVETPVVPPAAPSPAPVAAAPSVDPTPAPAPVAPPLAPPPRRTEVGPSLVRAHDSIGAPLARPVAFDLAIGIRAVSRHLSYNQDLGAQFQPYDLWIAPAGAVALEWFPGAPFTRGVLAHLGVYGEGDYTFGVTSQDSTGNTYTTTAYRFGFGLRVRIPLPLAGSDIGVLAGYSGQTFNNVAANTSTANTSIAVNVAYDALRAGLSLRLAVAPHWTVVASGGYLYVYSAGENVSGYFPRATVGAVDASAGLVYGLPAGFEVRAILGARRYFYAMNPMVGDPYIVGGALDHYFDGTLFIAWRH